MENQNLVIVLINGIRGLGFFVLAFVAIAAAVQTIKYKKNTAYFCIVLSIFAVIFSLASFIIKNNVLDLIYVALYTMMLISAILVWLNLRKSEKKSEKSLSFFLIILVAIQFIFPVISGFLKTLS